VLRTLKWIELYEQREKNACSSFSRKDFEINQLNGKVEEEQNMVAQLSRKVKELQVNPSNWTIEVYLWIAGCLKLTCLVIIASRFISHLFHWKIAGYRLVLRMPRASSKWRNKLAARSRRTGTSLCASSTTSLNSWRKLEERQPPRFDDETSICGSINCVVTYYRSRRVKRVLSKLIFFGFLFSLFCFIFFKTECFFSRLDRIDQTSRGRLLEAPSRLRGVRDAERRHCQPDEEEASRRRHRSCRTGEPVSANCSLEVCKCFWLTAKSAYAHVDRRLHRHAVVACNAPIAFLFRFRQHFFHNWNVL